MGWTELFRHARGILMIERLAEFVNRHEELSLLINDPDIIADQDKWRALMKE